MIFFYDFSQPYGKMLTPISAEVRPALFEQKKNKYLTCTGRRLKILLTEIVENFGENMMIWKICGKKNENAKYTLKNIY